MKNIFCRNYTSSHHRLMLHELRKSFDSNYIWLPRHWDWIIQFYFNGMLFCCFTHVVVSSQAVKAPLLTYMDDCDVTVLSSAPLGNLFSSPVFSVLTKPSHLSPTKKICISFFYVPHTSCCIHV